MSARAVKDAQAATATGVFLSLQVKVADRFFPDLISGFSTVHGWEFSMPAVMADVSSNP